MSQEWLKQLAELSNDKNLRKRAQQMQKAQPSSVRQTAGRQRSLVGAAFGVFMSLTGEAGWPGSVLMVGAVAMPT